MTEDSGNLSIDFLVGFTIFLIAFIWVVSMIPGLLIGLQAYTIDYDAVAYRTGVILVEDPGEPVLAFIPLGNPDQEGCGPVWSCSIEKYSQYPVPEKGGQIFLFRRFFPTLMITSSV